jgi:hypothetical protein
MSGHAIDARAPGPGNTARLPVGAPVAPSVKSAAP